MKRGYFQMKYRLIFLVVFTLILMLGCSDSAPKPMSVVKTMETLRVIDLKQVETIGNNSWIPIDKHGTPTLHRRLILQILEQFESANHHLEVISWTIDNKPYSYLVNPWVYGIWVHHRSKQK
ncbi:MAG: hypothetical protein QMD77_04470 [Patescibacteria group bacterium]|nr:hypothetical protein [Patescibacteria group bacterium]